MVVISVVCGGFVVVISVVLGGFWGYFLRLFVGFLKTFLLFLDYCFFGHKSNKMQHCNFIKHFQFIRQVEKVTEEPRADIFVAEAMKRNQTNCY